MTIWLALWIVISVTLIGFLVWSLYTLYQQKTSWKAFAAKHKLRYKGNSLMQSPEMDGAIDEYKISFFTGEHVNPDMRSLRKLTAVEIGLQSVMPIEGAVASGGMVELVKEMDMKFEIHPEHEGWNKAYIARGSNRFVLEAYLTDERVSALSKLMKMKNSWVILIFRKDRMLLRFDTPYPLVSKAQLEKIGQLMLKTAKILELGADEGKKLKAEEARGVVKDSALVLDEKSTEASDALTLEDDDEPAEEVSQDDVSESSEENPEIEKE